MLKASTGSSGSTALLGEPMRALDCASNWRGRSGLPRSPRINECPTRGVVEARSLTTSFDDPQTHFDSESCPRQTAEKPLFIVPLEGMAAQMRQKRHCIAAEIHDLVLDLFHYQRTRPSLSSTSTTSYFSSIGIRTCSSSLFHSGPS